MDQDFLDIQYLTILTMTFFINNSLQININNKDHILYLNLILLNHRSFFYQLLRPSVCLSEFVHAVYGGSILKLPYYILIFFLILKLSTILSEGMVLSCLINIEQKSFALYRKIYCV